jgi:hypothetical protein
MVNEAGECRQCGPYERLVIGTESLQTGTNAALVRPLPVDQLRRAPVGEGDHRDPSVR